ncbi:MAG: hypothetical protein WBA63_15240 [Thermomicrobiales bacterium]
MSQQPPDMPANVRSIDQKRAQKASAKDELYNLLSQIDELEDALETMDEHGVRTREELEALIGEFERRAEELDPGR